MRSVTSGRRGPSDPAGRARRARRAGAFGVVVLPPVCVVAALSSVGVSTARDAESAPAILDAAVDAAHAPDARTADALLADVARTDFGSIDTAVSPRRDAADPPPSPYDVGLFFDARREIGFAPPRPDSSFRPEVGRPIPPDPVPLQCDAVYVLTIRFERGALSLERVRHQALAGRSTLTRHFGRFAAELYVGPTLIERLRFDLPLIADDTSTSSAYEKGLVTSVDVWVPDSDRPTRLEVWDRATDRRWVWSYPPRAR